MTERKLVTIRRISELNPIPKADAIECAKIDGWNVVVRKGEFEVGDPCVFFEIDSVLPDVEPFKFLTEKQGKTFYNGKFGARLKTIRLRGQLSQGLALPLSSFRKYDLVTGKSLDEELGIWKYDPPPSAELAGKIAGSWPAWLPKTDQERCISKDTLITTDMGAITIDKIVEEKIACNVLSFNLESNTLEFKKVVNWSKMTKKNNNWVKITLKSGKQLICTKNHKIWCDDISSYREASSIQVGQKLLQKTEE